MKGPILQACGKTAARTECAQDLRAALATRRLQDASGQASPNQLLVLLDTPLVERTAICGNQVCESGERAPATASGLGALPVLATSPDLAMIPCQTTCRPTFVAASTCQPVSTTSIR